MSKLKEEYGHNDDLDEYGVENQVTGDVGPTKSSKKANIRE